MFTSGDHNAARDPDRARPEHAPTIDVRAWWRAHCRFYLAIARAQCALFGGHDHDLRVAAYINALIVADRYRTWMRVRAPSRQASPRDGKRAADCVGKHASSFDPATDSNTRERWRTTTPTEPETPRTTRASTSS
jgi:hypothetical protein